MRPARYISCAQQFFIAINFHNPIWPRACLECVSYLKGNTHTSPVLHPPLRPFPGPYLHVVTRSIVEHFKNAIPPCLIALCFEQQILFRSSFVDMSKGNKGFLVFTELFVPVDISIRAVGPNMQLVVRDAILLGVPLQFSPINPSGRLKSSRI